MQKTYIGDRKGSFSILFLFLFFLLLVVGLNYAINIGGKQAPVVAVGSSVTAEAAVLEELKAAGVNVVEAADASSATLTIEESQDGVIVLLDGEAKPQWLQVAAALERAGYSGDSYVVVDTKSDPYLDLLRGNLAALSCIGLMAIAFMGTSVPLTRMRENGTLRLLGTTPASKLTFILAQTPARLVLGLVVVITIFITSVLLGYAHAPQLLRVTGTMLIGLAMFFALAYLLASRSRNADSVNNIAAILPVLALFASGSVFPPHLVPDPVNWVLEALPTTWYTRAAAADLAGDAAAADHIWVYWALMIATTVIAAGLAARLFVWDDRER